jgi:hypothetical protein
MTDKDKIAFMLTKTGCHPTIEERRIVTRDRAFYFNDEGEVYIISEHGAAGWRNESRTER